MDRRSRRTRNALTTALMALLKERPLKSITVTELAELADVNRATFYVHFQDVYDMFDQVKEEFCNICRELVDAHGEELARNENRPFLEDIFSYFETNEDAFAIVFGWETSSTWCATAASRPSRPSRPWSAGSATRA